MVKKSDKGDYVLCRNLDQIDFWTFYQGLPFPLPRREDLHNCNITTRSGDEWSKQLLPYLKEADVYLAEHLTLPLSQLLENQEKTNQ